MAIRFLVLLICLLGNFDSVCGLEFAAQNGMRRLATHVPKPHLWATARWCSSSFHQPFEIIHPCTDYGFKRVMQQPHIATGFINHILDLKGAEAVRNVTYIDPYLPSLDPLGRHFTVDVICSTEKGKFLLEMQNNFREDYPDKAFIELCRLVSNWDRDIVRQKLACADDRKALRAGEKHDGTGDFWKSINRAIVLVVSNREFKPGARKSSHATTSQMEPEVINNYRMTHIEHPNRYLGDIDARVVLLMLGNFKTKEKDLKSEKDRWLYLFKDESLRYGVSKIPTFKNVQSLQTVADSDKDLQDFYKTLDKKNISDSDLSTYERDIETVNQVLEEREAEGGAAALEKVARNMIKAGKQAKEIEEMTGLSEEQIKRLKP
jgi:hypothetical protein